MWGSSLISHVQIDVCMCGGIETIHTFKALTEATNAWFFEDGFNDRMYQISEL
jgi:hypothetical protein